MARYADLYHHDVRRTGLVISAYSTTTCFTVGFRYSQELVVNPLTRQGQDCHTDRGHNHILYKRHIVADMESSVDAAFNVLSCRDIFTPIAFAALVVLRNYNNSCHTTLKHVKLIIFVLRLRHSSKSSQQPIHT
uniref:Uncharacterized protein n=2 Tax=Spongospora subterranea TaxID=70186 RepID=A0A0H5QS84_9EUKA|eukprot:CRZ04830.1 hypothetical protein [Spongospora subterranea]